MTVHLEQGVAELCISACDEFAAQLNDSARSDWQSEMPLAPSSFDSARELGTVYSLFAGEDLQSLLNGFVDQARAMSMLFAAAGGLIDAQDEAVAAALGKASQEAPALQSLGLMGSLGSVTGLLDAVDGAGPAYSRVGPEDVSGTPLERIVSGAQALDEGQFHAVKTRVSEVAEVLDTAAQNLRSELNAVLTSQWQGEFADAAATPVDGLTRSAFDLAATLRVVGQKADGAESGFGRTRQDIGAEAAALQSLQQMSALEQGPGMTGLGARVDADREAAEEQARAIMNTVYSPAVMDANLDGLDFPTAYRVVASSALGGPDGIDMARVWNDEGVIRPAVAGTPSPTAIASAGGAAPDGGGAGIGGPGGASAAIGTGTGPTDAGTQQALLAARSGGADMPGAGPAMAGTAGAGGGTGGVGAGGAGLNAGTAAAAAGAPMTATGSGRDGGAAGASGTGGRSSTRGGERGAGGSQGSTGGGAAASRLGGAGTLSGIGAPAAGAPGAGSAGAARPGMPAAGAGTAGAAGGRAGVMPMGMMGAAGAGQGNRSEGHRPASYLVNATNTSELLGKPVKVSPARIGARPPADPAADETSAAATTRGSVAGDSRVGDALPPTVSAAQALVNRLRGR